MNVLFGMRLAIALMGVVWNVVILTRTTSLAQTFRLLGLNGEITIVINAITRTAVARIVIIVLLVVSMMDSSDPEWSKLIVMGITALLTVLSMRDQRTAREFAQGRLSQDGLRDVEKDATHV